MQVVGNSGKSVSGSGGCTITLDIVPHWHHASGHSGCCIRLSASPRSLLLSFVGSRDHPRHLLHPYLCGFSHPKCWGTHELLHDGQHADRKHRTTEPKALMRPFKSNRISMSFGKPRAFWTCKHFTWYTNCTLSQGCQIWSLSGTIPRPTLGVYHRLHRQRADAELLDSEFLSPCNRNPTTKDVLDRCRAEAAEGWEPHKYRMRGDGSGAYILAARCDSTDDSQLIMRSTQCSYTAMHILRRHAARRHPPVCSRTHVRSAEGLQIPVHRTIRAQGLQRTYGET